MPRPGTGTESAKQAVSKCPGCGQPIEAFGSIAHDASSKVQLIAHTWVVMPTVTRDALACQVHLCIAAPRHHLCRLPTHHLQPLDLLISCFCHEFYLRIQSSTLYLCDPRCTRRRAGPCVTMPLSPALLHSLGSRHGRLQKHPLQFAGVS
jgi:hypothetical protein